MSPIFTGVVFIDSRLPAASRPAPRFLRAWYDGDWYSLGNKRACELRIDLRGDSFAKTA